MTKRAARELPATLFAIDEWRGTKTGSDERGAMSDESRAKGRSRKGECKVQGEKCKMTKGFAKGEGRKAHCSTGAAEAIGELELLELDRDRTESIILAWAEDRLCAAPHVPPLTQKPTWTTRRHETHESGQIETADKRR